MLYEFSSAAANNGSGFEGLGDNTPFWNISTGVVMLLVALHPDHRAAGAGGGAGRQTRSTRDCWLIARGQPARSDSPCGP